MKPIRDLEKALNNQDFYNDQFQESGHLKNILFVSPQLKGKHIYKFILPYFSMLNANIATAITSVEKFDEEHTINNPKSVLFPKQVLWADYIVFPFMLNRLGGTGESVYKQLKKINPNLKIVYHVDFNFYAIPNYHPYKKHFTKQTISNVEDNIYFSDLCLTSNLQFNNFLIKVIEEMAAQKYTEHKPKLKVGCVPILFDTEILLMNVDYDTEQPTVIDNRKAKKAAETADKEKVKTISKRSVTAKKAANKKPAVKKSAATKTTTKKATDEKTGTKTGDTKLNGGDNKSNGKPIGAKSGTAKTTSGNAQAGAKKRGRPPKTKISKT